jgi:hypothetical protein
MRRIASPAHLLCRYIRPARLYLIQPLIHLLLQARPDDVKAYIRRVFRVFATLMERLPGGGGGGNGGAGVSTQYPSGQVPLQLIAELLATALWSVTDEHLKLLNGVLAGISSEADGVQVVEFAIRTPLEISEKICAALVSGRPADPPLTSNNNNPNDDHNMEQKQGEENSSSSSSSSGSSSSGGSSGSGSDANDGDARARTFGGAPAPVAAHRSLSFRSIREETRLSRVRAELDDVLRAARLSAAMPRTVDDDVADECPEAAREAEQLRALVERLADARPERADWMRDDLPLLAADLKLTVALPARTRAGAAAREAAGRAEMSSDSEDEDTLQESRTLRGIVERGARLCEVGGVPFGVRVVGCIVARLGWWWWWWRWWCF